MLLWTEIFTQVKFSWATLRNGDCLLFRSAVRLATPHFSARFPTGSQAGLDSLYARQMFFGPLLFPIVINSHPHPCFPFFTPRGREA